MLGKLIYESKGKITCQRVLSVENAVPKLELSVKGTGIFKGSIEVTEIWTYWNMQRSNSITYGEGQGVLTTIDESEVATVTGRGVGKLIDSGLMRWNGTNIFLTTSNNRLAFLDHLIGVNEDEIDASGSYVHKL
ncbi:MAG: hypothetical protein WCF07_07120 [Nitrososphaeraceae archaeon]